ncbi:Hypothetical_protein [Hexamita inflata]|uniref:Hypothetical_protein n=1 Tax=Hexamita inflata TaxID=28002 RepID=A0AA86P4L8_9EUKA|nr:Hypothetical protein HINF_LOCUS18965 [Hexamita inflata]
MQELMNDVPQILPRVRDPMEVLYAYLCKALPEYDQSVIFTWVNNNRKYFQTKGQQLTLEKKYEEFIKAQFEHFAEIRTNKQRNILATAASFDHVVGTKINKLSQECDKASKDSQDQTAILGQLTSQINRADADVHDFANVHDSSSITKSFEKVHRELTQCVNISETSDRNFVHQQLRKLNNEIKVVLNNQLYVQDAKNTVDLISSTLNRVQADLKAEKTQYQSKVFQKIETEIKNRFEAQVNTIRTQILNETPTNLNSTENAVKIKQFFTEMRDKMIQIVHKMNELNGTVQHYDREFQKINELGLKLEKKLEK